MSLRNDLGHTNADRNAVADTGYTPIPLGYGNSNRIRETISSQYDIVKPERPSYHDPRRDFQNRIDRISASCNRRGEVEASQNGEASNITPLFSKSRRESSQCSLDADPKV